MVFTSLFLYLKTIGDDFILNRNKQLEFSEKAIRAIRTVDPSIAVDKIIDKISALIVVLSDCFELKREISSHDYVVDYWVGELNIYFPDCTYVIVPDFDSGLFDSVFSVRKHKTVKELSGTSELKKYCEDKGLVKARVTEAYNKIKSEFDYLAQAKSNIKCYNISCPFCRLFGGSCDCVLSSECNEHISEEKSEEI